MTRAANHVGKGITMRTTLKSLRLAIATSMLAILALIAPTQPAQATQQCIGTTTNGHGGSSFDADCAFMNVYTAYDGRIVVQYWGNRNFDFYQLRWSRPGRAETQSLVRGSAGAGSRWALSNAWENTPTRSRCRPATPGSWGRPTAPGGSR